MHLLKKNNSLFPKPPQRQIPRNFLVLPTFPSSASHPQISLVPCVSPLKLGQTVQGNHPVGEAWQFSSKSRS